MKIKNVKLEYYVFYIDNGKITRFNILKGLAEKISKNMRSSEKSFNHIKNREDLIFFLKNEFMYNYWCKTECEYGICDMWVKNIEQIETKDIWFQIEPNVETIADYIIYKMQIKF